MARFVAVPVFADPALNIGDAFALVGFLEGKKFIQLVGKLLPASH